MKEEREREKEREIEKNPNIRTQTKESFFHDQLLRKPMLIAMHPQTYSTSLSIIFHHSSTP